MAESKNTAAEVGVKLVLNSNAQAEAQHIAQGLKKIDHDAKKTSDGWKGKLLGGAKAMGGLALGASAAALAAAAAGGAAIFGLGHKSVEAFTEADQAIRGIAGTLMTIDQNANSFEKLYELGDDVKGSMEQIGIEAGVSADKTVSAFNNIIEHGGKTREETEELVREMALAGKVIPGGLDSIAMGYEQIQMGMVRAKNPLVQLISATGTLKGNAKDVAKQMQKMAPEEQMKLAEKAVAKFSGKMKEVPLTLQQMKTGVFDIVGGNIFENAGKPILDAMTKAFGPVHKWVSDNQDELYELGARFGEGLGKAVEVGALFAKEAWAVANSLWDEAQKTFDAMFGPGMDLFSYIYENKDAWAKTFGDVLKLVLQTGMFLVRTFASIRNSIGSMLKAIGKSGIFGEDAAKFIGQEEQKGQSQDLRKSIMAKGGMSNDEFDKRRAAYLESAKSSGMNVSDAASDFDKQYRNAMDTHIAVMKEVEGARDAVLTDNAKQFAQAFDVAAKQGDVAAMQYVAKFLEGNVSMQNAIAKEGPAIFADGVGKLMDTLKQMGDKDIASYLKDKMKPSLGKPSKTSITQNFNGAITVKQDFRDQDPDRVAIVFKKELGKMGSSRLQSRMASPFGF
jgi:hypothetical protein